jgi:hypothetical protein
LDPVAKNFAKPLWRIERITVPSVTHNVTGYKTSNVRVERAERGA